MRLLWRNCEKGRLLRSGILIERRHGYLVRGTTFKRSCLDLARSCGYEWERKGNPEDAREAQEAAAHWYNAPTVGCRCRVTRQSESPASTHWWNHPLLGSCVLTAPTLLGRKSSSTTAFHAPFTSEFQKLGHVMSGVSRTRRSSRQSPMLA
jgi:hypothetical protein